MKKLLYLFLLFPFLFFFPSFNVFAEGVEDQEETNSNTLGSMFNFYYEALSFSGWQNSGFNTGYAFINCLPNMSGSATNYPLSFDISDFSISPKQFIYFNRSGWSLGVGGYLVLVDNANVVAVTGNNSFALATTDGSDFNVETILYNADGTISTAENPSQGSSTNGVYIFTQSRRIDIMTASMYIYGSKNNYNISEAVSNIVLADDPLINGLQMNYRLFDENGELIYNNPFFSGGSTGEDASNNMFLNNPKWNFNNIPVLENVYADDIQKNLGTISFTAELTEYQKEHLNDFSIQFNFDTYLKLRFVNNDGTQTYTNQTFNIHKTVSLAEFYNNGLTDSNLVSNIWNGWYSTGNGNLTLNNYLSSLNQDEMFNPVVFQTQCKATLIHNNDTSGNLTTAYNYLNGASQTSDSGLGINPNPYNNDYDGFFDDQFTNDNGNNVSTNGNNNIINNNNPNITINNNNNNALTSDGDSNGLLSTLLLMITNNQTATSEGIAEVADTTGYVQVCGDVFTAIPSNWWLVLTAAFVSCIGILVISFAIKIILNIVT